MAEISVVRPVPSLLVWRRPNSPTTTKAPTMRRAAARIQGATTLRQQASGCAEQSKQGEGPQAGDMPGRFLFLTFLALDAHQRAEQDRCGPIKRARQKLLVIHPDPVSSSLGLGFRMLRVKHGEAVAGTGGHAALGDEPGDEA